jgi:hypothetical protein
MIDSPDGTVGREHVEITARHLHVVLSHLVEGYVGDVVPDDRLDSHAGGDVAGDAAEEGDVPPEGGGLVCW